MKKIKLISVLGLASALVLSGCGNEEKPHEHSFSDKWTTDSEYHWHKCSGCDEVSDKAEHLDEDHNGKCDVCNKTLPNSPMIKSISIEVAKKTLALDETITLTAKVTVQGGASDEVTWSVNNSNGSISSTTGKTTTLKAKKEGKVTVTLTSKFDETKKATAEFTIVDEGFMPELLDEGYKFTRVWPGDQIKAFGGVEIPSTETDEGFYYIEEEAVPGVSSSSFQILMVDDDSYYYDLGNKLFDAEYGYFSSEDYGDCFIDPSFKVEVDIAQVALDEEGEETLLCVNVYKTEEIWESSEPTEDTEWEPLTAAALAEAHFTLPFIKLGQAYDVYVYTDGTVEISDYCAEFTKLDNYGQVLLDAGFAEVTIEEDGYEYVWYEKDIDAYSKEIVSFGFTEYGNTIDVSKELIELEEYPSEKVAEFVPTTGTKYTLLDFSASEDAYYTYEEAVIDAPVVGEVNSAIVSVYNATEAECNTYVGNLIADGFVLDSENSVTKTGGVTLALLQKGKLCVAAQIQYGERAATQEEIDELLNKTQEEIDQMTEDEYYEYFSLVLTYAFTGELTFPDYDTVVGAAIFVYGDEAGMEDPGIYIKESKLNLLVGATYDLEIIHYEIEEALPVDLVSSNPEVATVDETGKVTAVAVGTTTITATCNGTSDSVVIKVTKSIKEANEALNAWIVEQGGLEEIELPEVSGAEEIEFEEDVDEGCFYIDVTTSYEDAAYDVAMYFYDAYYDVYELEDGGYLVETEETEIYVYDIEGGIEICTCMYEEEAEGVTFDFTEITDPESFEIGGFAYETAVGTNSNKQKPQYNTDKAELRLYIGNTITFTSEEPMTSIFFDANTCGETKADGTLSCDVGEVEEVDGGFYWEGEATEVTFSVDSGKQVHINAIEINGGGEGGDGIVEGEVAGGLQQLPRRPEVQSNPDRPLSTSFLHLDLLCDFQPRSNDFLKRMLPVVLERIRAEGVGVDDLRTRLDVRAVNRRDVVRTFHVPVFGTLPRLQSARLQERAHPAVEEERLKVGGQGLNSEIQHSSQRAVTDLDGTRRFESVIETPILFVASSSSRIVRLSSSGRSPYPGERLLRSFLPCPPPPLFST